jgi:hypothetical protein
MMQSVEDNNVITVEKTVSISDNHFKSFDRELKEEKQEDEVNQEEEINPLLLDVKPEVDKVESRLSVRSSI